MENRFSRGKRRGKYEENRREKRQVKMAPLSMKLARSHNDFDLYWKVSCKIIGA